MVTTATSYTHPRNTTATFGATSAIVSLSHATRRAEAMKDDDQAETSVKKRSNGRDLCHYKQEYYTDNNTKLA